MSDATELLRKANDMLRRYNVPSDCEDFSNVMFEIMTHFEQLEKAADLRGTPGGWDFETALSEHAFSLQLAWYIYQLTWPVGTVYDFGAGPGFYAQYLKQRGMHVQGFDYFNHAGLSLCDIGQIDLSKPFQMINKADTVLCLEVGEHIEPEFEDIVLGNICNHARQRVILSWAIPGQGGYGHVNCRENDYIIAKMKRRGWNYLPDESQLLRDHCSACPWFENTIMVFEL